MTIPRDIVRKTLEFDYPERVAHSFEPSDFGGGMLQIPNPDDAWIKVSQNQWQRKDVWGNIWSRVDDHSMGQVIQGALDELSDVETYPFPDFSDPAYYQNVKENISRHPVLWQVGHLYGLQFSMARKLRKLEHYLVDLVAEKEKIHILHNRIDRSIKEQIKQYKIAGVDSVMFCEDWGTQTQLFIRPNLWREEFKPRFADICRYAHGLGLTVIMHSCGKMTDIIPDLIETGIDVFQFDQPRIHGIDTLAKFQENARVTFWCPVDIQTTLQSRDEQYIWAEVNELLRKLWKGRGGFIAGYYSDNTSIGLEPKWQDIASREFLKQGIGH